MSSTLVGQKLGKYQITQFVGHGGMATVYKGYQEDVDRYVAVKVLPPHPGQTSAFVERFRQEARTIAKLQHPHILPLYDYGNQDEILYLVMPFIDGGTLHERIRRAAMPYNEIEKLVTEIAGALDYAHRQGVIHRDIKPDNILLNKDGFALLSDFGIAKLAESSGMSTTGGLVGTPAYIAPEQAQNAPIDGRADIYSFGIVVYEMLTGKTPFMTDTPVNVILKHITMPPPMVSEFVPGVPRGVDAVITRVLAKNPADRYQTAGAFADDLKRALQGYDVKPPTLTQLNDPNRATLRTPYPGMPLTTPIPGTSPSAPPTLPTTGTQPMGTPPLGTPPPTGMQFPGYYGSPTQPPMPTNPGVSTNGGINPAILIGGFAVLAVLLILVLIVLIRNQPGAVIAAVTPPNTFIEGERDGSPPGQRPTNGQPEIALPTAIPTQPGPQPDGHVIFATTNLIGDTANVQIANLPPPNPGTEYAVWLQNTMSNAILYLGTFVIDADTDGTLTYTGDHTLALNYDRLFVTIESTNGTDTPTEPTGNLVYEGSIPVQVASALAEILITSPNGLPPTSDATATPVPALPSGFGENYGPAPTQSAEGYSSLIDGAIAESDVAQRHAGLAAGATSVGAMHTHAEHTINILRGTHDDLDGSGQGQNPGRGIGTEFFLNQIDTKLTEAADGAPPRIQGAIEGIRVCVVNARTWMNEIITMETQMLASDSLEAMQPQMNTSTSDALALLDGTDLNQNGQIEAFEGECGLHQIADHGISIGNMDIYRSPDSAGAADATGTAES